MAEQASNSTSHLCELSDFSGLAVDGASMLPSGGGGQTELWTGCEALVTSTASASDRRRGHSLSWCLVLG